MVPKSISVTVEEYAVLLGYYIIDLLDSYKDLKINKLTIDCDKSLINSLS